MIPSRGAKSRKSSVTGPDVQAGSSSRPSIAGAEAVRDAVNSRDGAGGRLWASEREVASSSSESTAPEACHRGEVLTVGGTGRLRTEGQGASLIDSPS